MEKVIRQVKMEPRRVKLQRVAAYARVSSGKEAMLHSLSEQISYYSAHIQSHPGWEYAGVYADADYTGTKDSRPEFQRLLADCRAGKIDRVLTKSLSRFARNTVTLLEIVREMKALGVAIVFEKENIDTSSGDGELMLSILASFAQAESLSVSENCKWRIRKDFAEGKTMNLALLYGYRSVDGKIEIVPEEAEVVRRAFAAYLSGKGTPTIASMLRREHVPTRMGGDWYDKGVMEMLKNEKYTGDALLQKTCKLDHLSKKVVQNRGELPQYYVEGSHPAIIDRETFEQVQALIARNYLKTAPSKPLNTRYPFTGRILCEQKRRMAMPDVSDLWQGALSGQADPGGYADGADHGSTQRGGIERRSDGTAEGDSRHWSQRSELCVFGRARGKAHLERPFTCRKLDG